MAIKFQKGSNPNTIELKSSGSVVTTLFGLPFAAAGGFVMAIGLGVVNVGGSVENIPSIIFGAIFFIIGLLLIGGTSGTTIDLRRNCITKWWGLFAPMKSTHHELSGAKTVTLRKEVRKSGKSSRTFYPVRIEGESAAMPLELAAPLSYDESRSFAEQLAKFLRLPMMDSSSGADVVREWQLLDESIRERAKRLGEKIELPAQPQGLKAVIEEQGGVLKIGIPPMKMNPFHLVMFLPAGIFAVVVLVLILGPMVKEGLQAMTFVIAVFFIVAPIGVTGAIVLSLTNKSFQVDVSYDAIKVVEKSFMKNKSTEIPVAEIEELEVTKSKINLDILENLDGQQITEFIASQNPSHLTPEQTLKMQQQFQPGTRSRAFIETILRMLPGPEIIVRSDRGTVKFGKSLKSKEIGFIHALIKKKIVEG